MPLIEASSLLLLSVATTVLGCSSDKAFELLRIASARFSKSAVDAPDTSKLASFPASVLPNP